jgi:hypothetical protein
MVFKHRVEIFDRSVARCTQNLVYPVKLLRDSQTVSLTLPRAAFGPASSKNIPVQFPVLRDIRILLREFLVVPTTPLTDSGIEFLLLHVTPLQTNQLIQVSDLFTLTKQIRNDVLSPSHRDRDSVVEATVGFPQEVQGKAV